MSRLLKNKAKQLHTNDIWIVDCQVPRLSGLLRNPTFKAYFCTLGPTLGFLVKVLTVGGREMTMAGDWVGCHMTRSAWRTGEVAEMDTLTCIPSGFYLKWEHI
jgi:hypothetical protein